MAGEAALAIENARMLDDLRSQQRQVELLLNQAITIQEEERQRISIESNGKPCSLTEAAALSMACAKSSSKVRKACSSGDG